MKSKIVLIASLIFGLALTTTNAQPPGGGRGGMGGPPSGPSFGGYMTKLFGEHPDFSATMEMHTIGASGEMTLPGKFAVLNGNSRFEMDMGEMKTARPLPPQAIAQMKAMGMDKTIAINRPDKKVTYMIMAGMKAYTETPMQDADAAKAASDYKIEKTKIGEEKIDGHDCVKYKVVATDSTGTPHESTIWTATDMGGFPLKVETVAGDNTVTMIYKDVKTTKPDAALFEPPADFKKYNSYMELIMGSMKMPPR